VHLTHENVTIIIYYDIFISFIYEMYSYHLSVKYLFTTSTINLSLREFHLVTISLNKYAFLLPVKKSQQLPEE
jgi:hypothetical protein